MNKILLLEHVLQALELVRQGAVDAAEQASDTATHEENIAENKYDTLGLEAAYLAHGQARRVAECERDVAAFKRLPAVDFSGGAVIATGALITLDDEEGRSQSLLLGPAAGGLKLHFDGRDIMVITCSAPLGKALHGRVEGDELIINVGGGKRYYTITAVE